MIRLNKSGSVGRLPEQLFRRTALSSAILAAIAAAGTERVAAQEAVIEEITVTGTRVRRTDGMAEPTPVTTLTPAELSTFEPGSTVAEQLDALPQFFTTGTAQRGGPALFGDGGGSYLDMRGLGRDRTLVLLDGLRLPPADKRGQVNIDTLPTALIRSVDIVTGGASAAYGADALGGVTNFILDREFQGLKLKVSMGQNDFNSDGQNYNVSIAGGMEIGDRVNIIGSIETRQIDQFWRDPSHLGSWFQRWGWVNNPAFDPADPPGTNPEHLVTPWVGPGDHHVNGYIGTGPFGVWPGPSGPSALAGMRFTDDGSALVPLDRGTSTDPAYTVGGPDTMTNSQTRPGGPDGSDVDQTTAFFSVKFDLNDSVELFGDILYGKVETGADQIYSSAALNFIWSPTVYRDNAYLPDSIRTILDNETVATPFPFGPQLPRTSFRLAKGGSYPGVLDVDNNGRTQTDFDTEMFRIGFDWEINDNWNMRFSWQTGETEKVTGEYPSLRVDRFNLAIDAVEVYSDMRDVDGDGVIDLIADADRGMGTIVCNVQRYNPTPAELAATPAIQGVFSSRDPNLPLASPIGLDNSVSDCVPFNIMGNGQITQAAADYIMTPKFGIGTVDQDFAELLVTGEVSEGWGAGPISLATGLTYRDQGFSDEGFPVDVDELGPPFNAPELGIRGISSAWVGGSPNLHQFSTVSLLSGAYDVWEWFGELNVPIWESDAGNQRLGTSFAYRSSDYSSVGRVEAWKAGLDFQVARDLRLRATKSRDVREATFAERFDFGPGGGTITNDPQTGQQNVSITSTQIGNADLTPEEADTTVVGFVYQPGWAEGLSISVDRYEVDISASISTLTDDDIVNECFFNMVLCENVFRTTDGTLSAVHRPFLNLDQAKVRGADFEVAYSRDVDWFASQAESFSLRLLGGTLDTRTNTVQGSVPDELAGARTLATAGTLPELTANLTASYRFGPWAIQLQQRYIDELIMDRTFVEGVDIDDNTISSQSWTNLVFSREGEVSGGGVWRVTLNVQNLFDDDPPVIPANPFFAGAAQVIDDTHDVWGRRYQLTFNYEL
jgi:iron complex outermembrane receptor protein